MWIGRAIDARRFIYLFAYRFVARSPVRSVLAARVCLEIVCTSAWARKLRNATTTKVLEGQSVYDPSVKYLAQCAYYTQSTSISNCPRTHTILPRARPYGRRKRLKVFNFNRNRFATSRWISFCVDAFDHDLITLFSLLCVNVPNDHIFRYSSSSSLYNISDEISHDFIGFYFMFCETVVADIHTIYTSRCRWLTHDTQVVKVCITSMKMVWVRFFSLLRSIHRS